MTNAQKFGNVKTDDLRPLKDAGIKQVGDNLLEFPDGSQSYIYQTNGFNNRPGYCITPRR